MNDPSIFAQYGAIGIIAGIALFAVRILFKREVAAHDHDRERADRLEEELAKLNQIIRDQYIGVLAQATQAVAVANNAVRDAFVNVKK